MVQVLYPVFEIDGEEFVADPTMVLTSYPPKYHAYSLKDKRQIYVECGKTHGNKIMYPHDFYEWFHGKRIQSAAQVVDLSGQIISSGVNISHDSTVQVDPVTYPRPKTTEEKFEELKERVRVLEEIIAKLEQ